jgi:hypothetical protein
MTALVRAVVKTQSLRDVEAHVRYLGYRGQRKSIRASTERNG